MQDQKTANKKDRKDINHEKHELKNNTTNYKNERKVCESVLYYHNDCV